MRIRVPGSIQQALDELAGIEDLLRAKEWHRAAIVAAFVRLDQDHGGRKRAGTGPFTTYSATAFSELGIAGLRKKHTVMEYVHRWLDANDGQYPEPGKQVTLPVIPWPPTRTGTDGYETAAGAVTVLEKMVEKHGADFVADAVLATPKVSESVFHKHIDRVAAREDTLPGGQRISEMVEREHRDWERSTGMGSGRTREAELKSICADIGAALSRAHVLEDQGDLSSEELATLRLIRDRCTQFVTEGMERL